MLKFPREGRRGQGKTDRRKGNKRERTEGRKKKEREREKVKGQNGWYNGKEEESVCEKK